MSDVDVLKKSVTADDYNDYAVGGAGIMHFMLPSIGAAPDLPGFWSYARDWMLYSTIYRESMWAAAVYLAVTKQASKSWEVESDIPKRQKDAQQLFIKFGGRNGYVPSISKHIQSYLLTGNGGPVEVVRASGAPGAKVLGLVPLDPFRTIRTGNAQIPYLYRDRLGREHELRDYDAFCITDSPDLMDLWYGVGHCAAERAYKAITKLEAIERYIYEKVSGSRALALDFVSGVMPAQIKQAQDTAKEENAAKGVFTYLGSVIVAMAGDQAPTHVRINLAELPDGFERKEEFDIAVLTYARAIGIPVQDLQPLSGQGLGTGAQSNVLEESAKGQGMATWAKAFGHAVNEFALDDKTTFYFRENDIRDREREAQVRIAEATAISTWVTMQAITIEQARQLGVDRDQLPQEFIAVDNTPGDALSDSEKPLEESEVTPEDTEVPVTQPTEQTAPIIAPVETDTILKDARRIYDAIVSQPVTQTKALVPYTPATPIHSLSGLLDGAWEKIGEVDAVRDELVDVKAQVAQSLAEAQETQARDAQQAERERRVLNATLDALRNAGNDTHKLLTSLSKTLERESDVNAGTLKTLRAELEAIGKRPNAPTAKDVREIVVKTVGDALAMENVTNKHASDLMNKVTIIEYDKNGLASKARQTLADGSTREFRAVRLSGGRIKDWELIQ